MNEQQVEILLARHGDEIELRRRPTPTPKRIAWKPILVTGTAVAAIGAFVMLPRNAEAASIDQVAKALGSAKFWKASSTYRLSNGKWSSSFKYMSYEGRIRVDAPMSKISNLTTIIDSGFSYEDFQTMPCIIKEKITERQYFEKYDDPLQHAMHFFKQQSQDLDRKDGIRYRGLDAFRSVLKTRSAKLSSKKARTYR